MQATRRAILIGISVLGLSACVGGGGRVASAGPEPIMQPVPNPDYDRWVAAFRPRAEARGISAATYDRAFAHGGYMPEVIEKANNQTEFKRSLQDYLAITASDEKVANGKAALARYRGLIDSISATYGVEPEVIVAVWGVESNFGTRTGNIPVVGALSTLVYSGYRADFFEDQLIAALKIVQNGDVTPERMTGSWAGAMGQTQFIPTTYLAYAVDYDGDGRRDIWAADPTDALASTAAYLQKSGWRKGQPWGVEVTLPAGFDTSVAGRGKGRSTSAWAAMGVRDMNGRVVPDYGPASLLLPAGSSGPAFLIFNNFNAIARYNNAVNYVIGVGHLSDRIAGGPAIQGNFPPDAQGLTLADRQEIQRRLTAAGYDTQGTDGVIGKKSEQAIRDYQAAHGMAVTGVATQELLQALR
ncbi:lytic murein transglycosylase [Tabrizicola sp. J26]|uniref:lytic murein transglycosylase n=1 Tax=Alitabrizicola rongguiensis TaxID=2909234 RepID=UPI001F1E8A2C|nr:lytic murein transglycosylase [Tabrizicola rongguiensis]MCF1709499.1 lytic murein transglycosylase [Tabrizicola rongguiensis]